MTSYPRIGAGTRVLKVGPTTHSKTTTSVKPPTASAREVMMYTKRRMQKAERDERVDITKALTDVKTYMGGFTRPQDLRASNWFPGGAYVRKGKVYESPPPAAYEPHTVFLLQARHYTKHGVGRADSMEHVVGVCREGDLPLILAKYNSEFCPMSEKEIMDNAHWPWVKRKSKPRTVWWDNKSGMTRQDALAIREKELLEGKEDEIPASGGESISGTIPIDLAKASLPSTGIPIQRRAYHSSSRASASTDSTRTSAAQRRKIPASAWARPHKPSQDADDDVVPAYYIERKRQRDDIEERKETEGGLMSQLSAGILSEGIAAQTRAREGKIPIEVMEEDGTVRLPSGFEPPTPATDFHPVVAMPATEGDTPLVTPGQVSWDEALTPADAPAVSSSCMTSGSSGTRGFHTSAVARAREVPMHLLGASAPEPVAPAVQATKKAKVYQPKPQAEEDLMEEDEYYEEDVESLTSAVAPVSESAEQFNSDLAAHRARYFKTLGDEPFWRPVLTATFSTRPLAVTYARLARAQPRGLAFYVAVDEDDRKYGPTYSSRMNSLRTRRMRQLALDMASRLRGDYGGFPGIRFGVEERGRGINGDGLHAPIPLDKRQIQIGVGEWHPFGKELQTMFEGEAEDGELSEGFKFFSLDDWGRRSDGEEWRSPQTPLPTGSLSEAVFATGEKAGLTRGEKNRKLDSIAEEKGRELAYALSQRMRSVEYPHAHPEVPIAKFMEAYKPAPSITTKAVPQE